MNAMSTPPEEKCSSKGGAPRPVRRPASRLKAEPLPDHFHRAAGAEHAPQRNEPTRVRTGGIAHPVAWIDGSLVDDLGDQFGRARILGVLGSRGVNLVHEWRICRHARDV